MFVLSEKESIGISIAPETDEAVKIACRNLIKDLQRVLGISVEKDADVKIYIETKPSLSNKPETYRLFVKDDALYIIGNDRRGTIYGIYTFSRMLGVSPWYYFADVPVKKKTSFSLCNDFYEEDYPTVPYRGIFINDEEELEKWAQLHMKEDTIGYNTYEKIFELLLRLKANYIWPAMHVNSFNMQPESGALANKMGIVVGTSHCDMLMRSNYREWEPWIKKKGYINAEYDYSIEGENRDVLREYWKESVEQNREFEVSYTLGMRGIHDSGFVTKALFADSEEELKDKKVKLLEQVIKDQMGILKNTLNHDTLMTFVPYKEVLNLYDRGLEVPEDITLIWTNDNYGYVRRYPSKAERSRRGGNGIYYHNSYWAPSLRHYLFMSSQPLAQTKYEMEKAYENGIQKLWVVNMGAIKPLEAELQFFIELGWDIDKEIRRTGDVVNFYKLWINENFSKDIGDRAAKMLIRFANVYASRKTEHLEEDVFSQESYVNEAAIRLNTLKEIFDEGNAIYELLPCEEKEAFFQLVLMRIHAAYYSYAMYYFADRSYICSKSDRYSASREYTELSKGFEDLRRKMLWYYNEEMCEGKWKGIVTPEDFPPPRTAMHPASRPAIVIGAEDERDTDRTCGETAFSIDATEGKLVNVKTIFYLGRGTKDLAELGPDSRADYEFEITQAGYAEIELHRYPSLNSVGEIFVNCVLDDMPATKLVSESNDEWRGNWAENILNQVDKLTVFKGKLEAGKHTLKLFAASSYFAFSKLVVYEGTKCFDNLGIITPGKGYFAKATLPTKEYLCEANKVWYAAKSLEERRIPVGAFVSGRSVMDLTDKTDYEGPMAELFMPDREITFEGLARFGEDVPTEENNHIVIEAFSAYNSTENAWEKGGFDYSTGVSYRRTNMALYFRGRKESFTEDMAPTLNYKFFAEGGIYTIYVLLKYAENKAAKLKLEIDGRPVKSAWNKDSLWRYEGEQIFRYVPIVREELERGEHIITLKIFASNLRIERIIMVNN